MEEEHQHQNGSSVHNQTTNYGYGSSLAYAQSQDIESAASNALLREQVHITLFSSTKFQVMALRTSARVTMLIWCCEFFRKLKRRRSYKVKGSVFLLVCSLYPSVIYLCFDQLAALIHGQLKISCLWVVCQEFVFNWKLSLISEKLGLQ